MIKNKFVCVALMMLCLILPTVSLAKGKKHFIVEDSQEGLRLVIWEGKDSIVDFNSIRLPR